MTSNAEIFRSLHEGEQLLLLPNCWDAGSARVIESLGARALATTSAGVAWANGYPDGDALPVFLLVAAVRAIVRVAKVPVSVDLEGGYSDSPAAVAETVAALMDVGAVGINLEDGDGAPQLLADKIGHVKRTAERVGVAVFVNARTDVHLRELVAPEARVAEVLERARIYREAGADGIFVPKAVDPAELRTIAATVGLPVNVLAWPGLPPAAELLALGVRRLSAGSGIAQLAYGQTRSAAAAFLAGGDVAREGALPYAEMNPLFPR